MELAGVCSANRPQHRDDGSEIRQCLSAIHIDQFRSVITRGDHRITRPVGADIGRTERRGTRADSGGRRTGLNEQTRKM